MPNLKDLKRMYHNEFYPMRKLFLWGWDNQNNPSFIVFYGLHEFEQKNVLKETVTYTDYMIFRGKEGHFPSFEAVKILDRYDYKLRRSTKRLYYKKDIGNNYWYGTDEKNSLKEFRTFHKNEELIFPYFEKLDYKIYVETIRQKKLTFNNFKLAENPNEVLNLDSALFPYSDIFYKILTNPNIYMRKKYLKELISSNPLISLYDFILNYGSSELISGLFLEFSSMKDDRLLKEAQKIIDSNVSWAEKSYADGIKRCALLYINSFDKTKQKETIDFIYQTLPEIDLPLLYANGEAISKDKVLGGKEYDIYAMCGYLSEYHLKYSSQEKKYVKQRQSFNHYNQNYYCDGLSFHVNHLKNTLQQCELYGLSDAIGKIAYYLDAPRLHYHLRANEKSKALLYFKRYVRRILDYYAKNEEDKFIEAIKILFTSYTQQDYLCSYEGNFQFNYFIKYYLYNSFKIKGIVDWYEREPWKKVDQLSQAEGRFEFMPQLWDKHLDAVIDIITNSKVIDILKAFYYILNDDSNKNNLTELSYDKLIKLSDCPYELISIMFMEILSKKIQLETTFNFEIMISLLQCSNEKIQKIALEYFKATNGKFSPQFAAEFMILENFPQWTQLWKQGIEMLEEDEFILFIKYLFETANKFPVFSPEFENIINNILFEFTNKVERYANKWELLSLIASSLYKQQEIPCFLLEFAQKLIFSLPYEQLKNIVSEVEIQNDESISSAKNKLIVSFLESIKNKTILSPDSQIIQLLETGSTEMIKTFVDIVSENKSELEEKNSSLLLLLESDVETLNRIAKDVFEHLPEKEQVKFHLMILDSPQQKVYCYGLEKLYELYKDKNKNIPPQFILQMMEHSSFEVRAFISDNMMRVIKSLGNGDKEIFMYYVKTLLFLPNKLSNAKQNIYEMLPAFVNKYKDKLPDVEKILLDIGNSNIILDSERALVTLAKIKKEVILLES